MLIVDVQIITFCSCIYKLIFCMSGLPSGSVFPRVIRFVEPGLYEMQKCECIDCIEFIVGFWSLNGVPLNKVM
jgi:hypothetical protein